MFHLTALPASWTAGDRISLPAAVLEALHTPQDQQAELLTFEVKITPTDPNYSSHNTRKLTVGVRDFASCPNDATVLIPPHLLAYLIHSAADDPVAPAALSVTLTPTTIPKATSISLRPASAAYQSIPDLRAVLESHLRSNYTVLTEGTSVTLSTFVPATLEMADLTFHVERVQPNWAATVVNTDVEVTVLPVTDDTHDLTRLTDEYKREVARNAPVVVPHGSAPATVPVRVGQAQCFAIKDVVGCAPSVPATRPVWLRIESAVVVAVADQAVKVDSGLYFHPFIRPSMVDNWAMSVRGVHVRRAVVVDVQAAVQSTDWSDMFVMVDVMSLRDVDGKVLFDGDKEVDREVVKVELKWEVRCGEIPDEWVAEAMATEDGGVEQADSETGGVGGDVDADTIGKVQCNICSSWIRQASLTLHQLHCARNTTKCPTCATPLPRALAPYHVHCPSCPHLSTASGAAHKHTILTHPAPSPHTCPSCPSATFATPLSLAAHRRTHCPLRIHFCRFCLTHTPADGGSVAPAHRLSGLLTPHQVACAARTVDCFQCGKPVTRRDVAVHMAMHKREKEHRPVPCVPCANRRCGRIMGRGEARGKWGLCATCYSPLYSSRAPEPGKSEAQVEMQRVVHRYFRQATNGCGASGCRNAYCKTGRGHAGSEGGFKAADPTGVAVECFDLAKRLVNGGGEAWFCVPAGGRAEIRRKVAEEVNAAHGWAPGWTLWAAVQVESKVFGDHDESADEDDEEHADKMQMDGAAEVGSGVSEEKRIEWATRAVEWLMANAPAPKSK